MTCRECPKGRRMANRAVWCIPFGMFIREDHECTREGWKIDVGDTGDGEGLREEAELQEDSGGAFESLSGILPEPGEREGFPGMEEGEE